MVKIERNIPIPNKQSCPYGIAVFRKLEVGDSFWVELETKHAQRVRSMSQSVREYVDKTRKFTIRREGNGYRVWRIA